VDGETLSLIETLGEIYEEEGTNVCELGTKLKRRKLFRLIQKAAQDKESEN
jgi:hypothetical protein